MEKMKTEKELEDEPLGGHVVTMMAKDDKDVSLMTMALILMIPSLAGDGPWRRKEPFVVFALFPLGGCFFFPTRDCSNRSGVILRCHCCIPRCL